MTVYGAVHAGAGMVRFLGADRPAQVIGSQLPNVVFSPGRVQAHLFGSGWGERVDGARRAAGRAGLRAAHGGRRRRAQVPARAAARQLAAHPARRRAGPAARRGALLGHRGPGPGGARRGSQDRGDRAAQGGHPAGRQPRTGTGCEIALPGPGWTGAGRLGRHPGRHVCGAAGRRAAARGRRGAGRLAAGVHRGPRTRARSRRPAGRARCRRAGPAAAPDHEPSEDEPMDPGHPVRRDRAAWHRPQHGAGRDRPGRLPGQPRRAAGPRRVGAR